jgi:hypothetical protein
MKIKYLLFLIINIALFAQKDIVTPKKNWYASIAYGLQMSGIKSEDFISSNVAPLTSLAIGVWFTPEIALQLGYKGNYYHTISDNNKHYYGFVVGEVLLNINEIVNGKKIWEKNWKIVIHSGAGYFYNNYYNRPNVCGNFGIISSIKIIKKLNIFVDISAIVGWDLYQGDDDILPGCVLGVQYLF